ncbi:MAG TPA: glycogen synthase GlgA [Candidatus Olsenella pullistercoris]|uniref:Glycogen synthase n=1 Tax=Candidatus Olsenella pullistercoris TaxID=2838712 RepID=A0A9D2JEU3_9ACTN|nr:glycogen synthase GlgA [Candidatus Olsenella pullistercoris]
MSTNAKRRKLRVLFASSEAVPFAKTGGLGDVAGSLPRALKHAGARVAVILPKYASIPQEYKDQMRHVTEFYVPLAWRNEYCGIERLTLQDLDFYFIDNEAYFKRDGLYGYFDDGERFAFFAKAICEAIAKVPELECDVLHCNDWQTALSCVFLREFYQQVPQCANVKTVFTVHNVKFQGQYGDKMLDEVLGLGHIPAARDQLYCDRDSINFMKGALCYADALTTVSPSYAYELQMPFYGEGLDDIFRRRQGVLHGILNGIDQGIWNPSTDAMIPVNYTPKDLAGKAECKRALQEELGLAQDPTRPLVVSIGRLTDQKGLGLVRYAMEHLMQRGVQVAILGTGDKDHEDAFRYFDAKYGDQMCARIAFDNALSHRMYAGGDLLLMPSEFEPCGLSQMIAMRYGTLPVVRETGGLRDSVVPFNKYTGEGTGFSFANMNADEMADTLLGACEIFWTDPEAWHKLQLQAMDTDFSWRRAANDYMDIYHDLHPEIIRYNKRRDR